MFKDIVFCLFFFYVPKTVDIFLQQYIRMYEHERTMLLLSDSIEKNFTQMYYTYIMENISRYILVPSSTVIIILMASYKCIYK